MSTKKTLRTNIADKVALKKAQLLEALEKSLGVVTSACKACNISRTQFYEYVNTDPDFAASVRDIDEVLLDFAEAQLYKQIKEGNTTATIFFLKTKGQRRGYIERAHVEHSGTMKTEQHVVDYSKLSEAALEEIVNAAEQKPNE